MINISNLEFIRVAAHRIEEKKEGMEHAIAYQSKNILSLTDKAEDVIRGRLNTLMNYTSKRFDVEIEDGLQSSFFGNCLRMKDANDENFINRSYDIAELLAESMKTTKNAGGILFVIQAKDNDLEVYIAIMSEYGEAISLEQMIYENGQYGTSAEYTNDVLLSADRKLNKACIIYEDDFNVIEDVYHAILLDPKFKVDSILSEYFYKDFLGCTVINNPKIQSKRFYDATENFIQNHSDTYEKAEERMSMLRNEFVIDPEADDVDTIDPLIFSANVFDTQDELNAYAADVANYLPKYIFPDDTLIRAKLDKITINFPNKVKLAGPSKTFDLDIQIIDDPSTLFPYNPDEPRNYTLVKILGKPNQII